MIHICYCFRDKSGRYSKFAGTSLLSVLENTKEELTIHILHDNTLTAENRDKFTQLVERYDQAVKFYNLDELAPKKVARFVKLVGLEKNANLVGAFYKLFIPQVLPETINKVIFFDPDTVVNLDVGELWKVKLGKKILGVVTETKNGVKPEKAFLLCKEGTVNVDDYFNCGVLLMNLKLLRDKEKTIIKGVKFRAENPNHKYLEQTVLNYCFSTNTVKLGIKFNCFVRKERSSGVKEAGKKIYHYAGGPSRPGLDMSDPLNALWMNYFIKTPWFDAESIGRLYNSFHRGGAQKDSPLKLAMSLPGKTRAFFVEPAKLKSVTELFVIKDYEEVILAENEDSVDKLVAAMKDLKGTCVFFIMTEKIAKKDFPLEKLTKAGMEEGRDFLKAWEFFSAPKAPTVNPYSLIEAM